MRGGPVLRPAERGAYCRSCDTVIPKGTDMVSWFTFRNRGQHIHICLRCAESIGQVAATRLAAQKAT
jgi:hypothetical protein